MSRRRPAPRAPSQRARLAGTFLAEGQPAPWRRGMVLVLVLIVVSMLTLAGYSFSELMFIEHKGARLAGRRLQTRVVVESAAEAIVSYLGQPRELQAAVGGHWDNPEHWQAVLVLDDPQGAGRGRFSVIAPPLADDELAPPRFGLADESARLNLSALLTWDARQPGAGRMALMEFPGMTIEVADALLDWMDADEEPREAGAEREYYERLETPVLPANQMPTTIDELLLVRGVTRGLLYGDDANRNGMLDVQERTAGVAPLASGGVAPPLGWANLLTLHSAEANRDEFGQPRIDLNSADLPGLHRLLTSALDRPLADFVIHFRQFGPLPAAARSSGGASRPLPADLSLPGAFRIGSPWDLIGAAVSVPGSESPTLVDSPLSENRDAMRQYLPNWLDRVTTTSAPAIVGRVSVNEASRQVLTGVPGLDAATIDELIAKRPLRTVSDPLARHAAWLVLEEIVDLPRMRSLWPYLTGGGDVYRAQLVGYLETAAPVERVEIIVAATSRPARLVSWKDLRALGPGYSEEVLVGELLDTRR